MKQCVKMHVTGKVQGVGFRDFAQKQAQILQIEGAIQNVDNGEVSILACGSSSNLDTFIEQMYKGSPASKVLNVAVEPFLNNKDFRGVFRIIR